MAYLDRRTAQPEPRQGRGTKRVWAALTTTLALVVTLVGACSDSTNPAQLGGGTGVDSGQGDPCALPNEGCACKGEGVTVSCGEVTTRSGSYVTCTEGNRTCTAGKWSACVGDHMVFRSIRPITNVGGAIHTADYGVPVACTTNPCDPDCQNFPDNSAGVDAGGLVPFEGGFTLADATPPPDAIGTGCVGLQCQVSVCADGGIGGTKLTGTVYDPASLNPLYNVLVAIPNGVVPVPPTGVPRPAGACGGVTLPPVITYTNTAYNGTFTLTGVPAGNNIPVLIQSGQWQRIINVNVTACTTQNISANCGSGNTACQTRLPRTKAEGHIPKIAIATGSCDAMECLLYRIGLDSTEFTDENGTGRVNLFRNNGSQLAAPNANHDVSYLLGFTCPNGKCPAATLPSGCSGTNITNGGFESGNVTGWAFAGSGSMVNVSHAGNWAARLGATSPTNTSTLTQTITAPAGAAVLQFWYNMTCNDGVTWDWATANLHDNNTNTDVTMLPNVCSGNGTTWVPVSTPVVPGHVYVLTLTNRDDGPSNDPSYTSFDDVQFCTTAGGSSAPNLTPNYDLIMLPCDCGNEFFSGNWGVSQDEPGRVNLVNYANIGGRLFASHWAREWIDRVGPSLPSGPFPNVASWYGVAQQRAPNNACASYGCNDPTTGYFDTSFQRGIDFATWMGLFAGSATNMTINGARYDVASITANSNRFVKTWGDSSGPGGHGSVPDSVADLTFDTPVGSPNPIGRTMFTDMHLASGGVSGTFPTNCPAQGTALTQQEKAAEFLLFDLGACVGTQLPPPVVVPPVWYNPASVSRVYNPTCPMGKHVVWRFFYWEDVIPATDAGMSANIIFTAQTATTQAGLGAAPSVTLATVTTTNLSFVGVDVGAALATIPSLSKDFLQLTFTLNPSSDHQTSPTLLAWQLNYDCVDTE